MFPPCIINVVSYRVLKLYVQILYTVHNEKDYDGILKKRNYFMSAEVSNLAHGLRPSKSYIGKILKNPLENP